MRVEHFTVPLFGLEDTICYFSEILGPVDLDLAFLCVVSVLGRSWLTLCIPVVGVVFSVCCCLCCYCCCGLSFSSSYLFIFFVPFVCFNLFCLLRSLLLLLLLCLWWKCLGLGTDSTIFWGFVLVLLTRKKTTLFPSYMKVFCMQTSFLVGLYVFVWLCFLFFSICFFFCLWFNWTTPTTTTTTTTTTTSIIIITTTMTATTTIRKYIFVFWQTSSRNN